MSLSAADQYLLELMNRARLDPGAEAARYGIGLNDGLAPGTISASSKQVLAPNEYLDQAATSHTMWMLQTDTFSHTGAGGSMPWDRATSYGYDWTTVGENIAWVGTTGTLNLESSIESINRNLFLSAGHRTNLMNDSFSEVGVSVETGVLTSGANYNAAMATELFGDAGSTVFLTGVGYTDTDGDAFYSMGEGAGGIRFAAQGSATTTAAAGGYSLALAASASVAVTGQSGSVAFSCTVDLSKGNVKLDLVSGTTFLSSGSITLGTGIQNVTLLGLNGLNATGNAVGNELTGNKGNNRLDGLAGDDKLSGGGGNDQMLGGAGKDTIVGSSGTDKLTGGSENDNLNGGAGSDTLTGDAGKDRLIGGADADIFVFHAGDGRDTITDFAAGSGDVLQLDDAIWGGGALSEAAVVSQYAAVTAEGVLFDFGGGNTILLAGLTTTSGLAAQIDLI